MTDEQICECGDYRKDHDESGECMLCRWAPSERVPCKEFRLREEKAE